VTSSNNSIFAVLSNLQSFIIIQHFYFCFRFQASIHPGLTSILAKSATTFPIPSGWSGTLPLLFYPGFPATLDKCLAGHLKTTFPDSEDVASVGDVLRWIPFNEEQVST